MPPIQSSASSHQACVLSGQAEIDQPGPASIVDQDILGLDVLVSDPVVVEVGDGLRQLDHEPGGRRGSGRCRATNCCKVSPLTYSMTTNRRPSWTSMVDDPHQVGMFALGQQPPLAMSARRGRPGPPSPSADGPA